MRFRHWPLQDKPLLPHVQILLSAEKPKNICRAVVVWRMREEC